MRTGLRRRVTVFNCRQHAITGTPNLSGERHVVRDIREHGFPLVELHVMMAVVLPGYGHQ